MDYRLKMNIDQQNLQTYTAIKNYITAVIC